MIAINLLKKSYNHESKELIKGFLGSVKIVEKEDREEALYIENRRLGNTISTIFYSKGKLVSEGRFLLEDGFEDRDIKNRIKREIYDYLSKEGASMPWGILTGIRPSKLVHSMLDQGWKEDRIRQELKDIYRLNIDKIDLIYKLVKAERKHIYPLDKKKFSIYISIPFCPTTCLYCSFPSCNVKVYRDQIDRYTDLLIEEIEEVGKFVDRDKIQTVYIGGGTPTAIPVENLSRIIDRIYKIYGRDRIKEFTVEAGRPDTISDEYLKMFSQKEIDRISINPQTMNDRTLGLIGRSHKVSDIERVYARARELGDFKINMDLIVGLPGEDRESIRKTMEKIQLLNPDNLTVHTLSVKKGSRFKERLDEYNSDIYQDIDSMLDITREYAGYMDMKAYYLYRQKQSMGNFENIGYGKEASECLYNIHMMEERQTILAFGMGSVSKIFDPHTMKIKRVPNVKSLEEYMSRQVEMVDRKLEALGISRKS